jgi:hypothetical protein
LVIDPPLSKIAKERRKFPAGISKLGILGWLCQVKIFSLHIGLLHTVVTTTSVPTSRASTMGPSDLQEWQNLNSRSNCVQNTMYLGSVCRFPLVTGNLQKKKNI